MTFRSFVAWALVLLTPLGAAAQDSVAEVQACINRNVPKKSSEQIVQFSKIDRIGGRREFRGKLLLIRLADGTRRAKLCVTRPPEMRSSEVLSVENASGQPDTFVYTVELRKPTRISGGATGASVFGTDFSYEDLRRLQLLDGPASHERLPDAELAGRPVYVLASRPDPSAESAYTKLVSYVDKQTCVVLKSEAFASGDRLSKVLTVQPDDLLEEGGIHAPSDLVLEDVLAETRTVVEVDDLDVDGDIDERTFEVSSLGRHCR